MSVDYHLALSDHYKAVRARLNNGPPRAPVAIAPPPPPEPEPEPEPSVPEPAPLASFQYTMSAARRIARAALVPHGMTWTDAMGPSRTLPYTNARADVYKALRKHGWSLMKIGIYCGRDHTTIMNALQPKKDRLK
jgi:hypothetical protein